MTEKNEALRLAEFYEALAEEPPKSPDNSKIRAAAAELRRLSAENEALRRERDAIQQVVDEQAEDEGLWFRAETAAEAYLQQELRRLHAAVEGKARAAIKAVEGEA